MHCDLAYKPRKIAIDSKLGRHPASASMLPIVARGQSMDGALAKFAGVPFAALRGLTNSCCDDFAVHLRLTDIVERLTGQLVCLVHGGDLLWIKGQILEELIRIGHDSPG